MTATAKETTWRIEWLREGEWVPISDPYRYELQLRIDQQPRLIPSPPFPWRFYRNDLLIAQGVGA